MKMSSMLAVIILVTISALPALAAPASKDVSFDFTKPDQLWTLVSGPQPSATPDGIVVSGPGELNVASPKLDLDAASFAWMTVMAKSTGAEYAVLSWVSDQLPGAQSYTIPLKTDGLWHVYNIRADEMANWIGRVQTLSLKATIADGQSLAIRLVAVSPKRNGPAEFEIRNFGFRDPVNRVGAEKPAVLQAELVNVGGEPVQEDITVHLRISPEVKTTISADTVPSAIGMKPGESRTIVLNALPEKAGISNVVMTVSNKTTSTFASANLAWLPAAQTRREAYVPEPKPVRGDFEVGMYYYPGWRSYASWSVLDAYPERRPLLGYYREGEPEVADWQIKWMAEHGVTFMVYDWYWSAGGRSHDHALHQGFFNAKYRDRIKFCLLWANHNAAGTSSAEDMANVTNYWLDNYFLRPEYFKVDGKPVVVIFSPGRLTEDMGADGVRDAFNKSREMAKARGLAGIYFVACTYPNAAYMKTLEQEGYDATSGYNYPSAGDKGNMRAPYADMVTGYEQFWNAIADSTKIPYIPVTEPGWDSRPWHGANARARTGKTPALFEKMLGNAKAFVETRNPNAKPKMVLVEAWNEFGEGDYVEPCKEFGFGCLDAIRNVFAAAPKEHDDILPVEVGLGPYDLEKPKPATAWDFDDPKSPGWQVGQNISESRVENGSLIAVSTGNDPALVSDGADLDSKKYRSVEIRMRVDKGKGAQLFWATEANRFIEAASASFALNPDGEFHVYHVSLADSPAWKSRITGLRFDPTDAAGAQVAVDYIKFLTRR